MSTTSLLLRFAAFGGLAFGAMAIMSALAEMTPTGVVTTASHELVCIDDGASDAIYRYCFEADAMHPSFPVKVD